MEHGARPTRITTVRRIALVAAPLLLALATAGQAASSWKPLPPFGGPVLALAAADGAPLLYAGTETAGPLRSRNGGATWMPPAQVPGTFRILELVVDRRNPNVVFAAAQTLSEESAGVLRSLDGGVRWQPVNQGLGGDRPLHVADLTVDPFDPQKVYAATQDGLYQTRDRGASWQQVGLDGSPVLALAVHPFRPGALFAAVFQGQERQILASLDGGATWTPSDRGIKGDPAFSEIVFHPTSPDTLFAFGNGWPTHVSRDGGATWTNLGRPLVSLAFGSAGALFGAPYGENGVLKSVDGGLTWSRSGALPDRITQLLAAHGRLYAAGGRGVWVSSDNGASWHPSSRGLSARDIEDLTESGSFLYGTFAEGVLASGTGGTSWRQLDDDGNPEAHIVQFLAAGPGAIYALEAQGEFERIALVRSTDGGASWTELALPGLGGTFTGLAVDPRHPAILYAGASENSGNDFPPCHLARSRNGGRSWSCLATEVSVRAIAVEPATSTPYLIAAGNMFALAGGRRFEFRGTGLPANGTLAFAFDPRRAGTLYAATVSGVFRTVNGGRSWTPASRGLPAGEAVYSIAVDPRRENVVYAGLVGQVYRSLDAGRSWRRLGNGLPKDAPITDLLPSASDPSRLYAVAAGHGLFWQDSTIND
jgi:photosystem II stability/assembly factor-like uncharacterized protein